MSDSALVDSGAFIAFLDRSDRLHSDVTALFAEPPRDWLTSILIVSETYSWFLHRLGEDAARTFAALITELDPLRILDASSEHHAAALEKLDHLRGIKLTYVDASSLVWLEQLGIRTVWGCDYDLAVEGAMIVPGAPVP